MKMPWESAIDSATSLVSEFIEDPDKKAEWAGKTAIALINNKTTKLVDSIVKLAYASEMITKGLVRPLFSVGIFIWGLNNPEKIAELHELGTIGDMAIGTIFGSAPAWGYSRHKQKADSAKADRDSWDDDL